MQPQIQQKEIDQFKNVAQNPAQALCFSQTILVQKGKDQPKVQRTIYMSSVCLYVCHKALITRKIFYRSIKRIVVALLSGECLIMLNQEKISAMDMLIDSFDYRQSIVNIIMKNNKDISIVYREQTTLAKYITVIEKGRLVSTPLVEPTGLSTFKKLMESYKSELTKTNFKQFLKDLTFWELIYQGTTSKIYFAEKKINKEFVAVKIQSKEMIVGQNEYIQKIKFQRELLERIDSPFIYGFKQSFMSASNLFWVFEYVNGYTLDKLINKVKTFPEPHIQLYVGETAVALGHLHEAGVSYNNLTTNHIMLDLKGHVKLINLRHCADLETFSSNSPPIMYLSPQRALNSLSGASAPADWWSLGVIMYQLLFAGRYPFTGGSRQMLIQSLQKNGVPTEGLEGHFSEHCINLLKNLLNKNPQERIGSKNGYHEVLAHPFFDNCRQEIIDRTHSTYSSSRGHAKHEHKEPLLLKLDEEGTESPNLEQLQGFEFSIDT